MAKKREYQQTWEGYIDVPIIKADKEAMAKLHKSDTAIISLVDEWVAGGFYRVGVGYVPSEGTYRTTFTGLEGSMFPNKTLVGYGSTPTKSLVSALHKLNKLKSMDDVSSILSPQQEDFA